MRAVLRGISKVWAVLEVFPRCFKLKILLPLTMKKATNVNINEKVVLFLIY